MSWYKVIKAKKENERNIVEMFGEVGYEITASQFSVDLKALDGKDFDLIINSPGGSVFEGLAVYEMIKNYPGKVTTYINGIAASMGSVIPMATDKIIMGDMSVLMVHNPWTIAGGEAEDFRKAADTLDKLKDILIKAYVNKTGLEPEAVAGLMDAETWMSAEEAKEFGFVDEINEDLQAAACLSDKITVPEKFKALIPEKKEEPKRMSKKFAEAKLRLL
jgi:ATP-dependent Clp endopeptidase proteolytic subunit ClpP